MCPKEIQKLYYSVSEVSDLTGVKPHVLRFWEKEFPMLRPKRGKSGNRSYREREIDVIRTIKRLLYEEKYTIQGAVEKLRQGNLEEEEAFTPAPPDRREDVLQDVRHFLLELRDVLEGKG